MGDPGWGWGAEPQDRRPGDGVSMRSPREGRHVRRVFSDDAHGVTCLVSFLALSVRPHSQPLLPSSCVFLSQECWRGHVVPPLRGVKRRRAWSPVIRKGHGPRNQRMPVTADRTKPGVYYVFFPSRTNR